MENTPKVEDILKLMKRAKKNDRALVARAFEFAQKAHQGQTRVSGNPYFIHVFETARKLAELNMNAQTIAAGLLHDTLEDAGVPRVAMIKEFGEDITRLVDGVTKLGTVKYRGRERHIESLRKFLMSIAEDVRVLIIKLCDRLHNLRTLQYLSPEKQKRIAVESIEIYAALANRLGMGNLKGDIEDAAFPYAYPKEYEMAEKLIQEKTEINKKYLDEIYKTIKKEIIKQGIKIVKIDYRFKHKYSLYKKLVRHNMDIDKIYDIVALRVIVPSIECCYRVLGLIHTLWRPLQGRIKDYIAVAKPNGYRALHTTIFTGTGGIVEIQIYTPEMYREAKYGIASHVIFKEGGFHPTSGKVRPKFAWLNKLKDLQQAVLEQSKFLEHLKIDFFKDRIFVFTPKGEVVDLPEESCPIDFAYTIHSDIGDHIWSAKVNGKVIALDYKLRNGDFVEIVTKKESHPSSRWMEYVKTPLARKHIKNYLDKNSLMSRLSKYMPKK
ncbi:hypothetical protein A3I25_00055 [Candidatus Nomurabacteria bacterium RIFCSPLOWO2_02_FULL_42_17]|uniref:TGS domain-containing protein n=2 Tax=Candidatus Nomuraibacteriota TaxID=1752729 RepID=A0A1F6WHP3_9BACT|nr:MAG: (P)ppGpp synthetase I, SpoT/RelA [Parcubacteria group bacterium GW2011_GWA2_42_18]OGI81399.1 MAG: hypothetical protein A3B93_01710 [Candidatus Nomurabacteria bacterium RIFCSPHIGHO2_02_FULL_42_24]OGI96410.1 MAG: hypothetical protein A3I25_00055 [Candidatus Nomurabacteria bacterium RIFCSPLOWO2_02_FULL_42_17]